MNPIDQLISILQDAKSVSEHLEGPGSRRLADSVSGLLSQARSIKIYSSDIYVDTSVNMWSDEYHEAQAKKHMFQDSKDK